MTIHPTTVVAPNRVRRSRSVADLLLPIERLARTSANLLATLDIRLASEGGPPALPRCVFVGPRGGGEPIRLGLFAGIHGDEPVGSFALIRFLQFLDQHPDLAEGYCLFAYPVCNPIGFENNTRHSGRGRDLNREFWRNSGEPEIQFLESELVANSFHGIISLHADDSSDGVYGYTQGATITRHLIEPALRAAEQILPRNQQPIIDGFKARNGVIRDCFEGVLSASPKVRPRPFEIILETPHGAPQFLQEQAFVAALGSILGEYRKLIAFAPNL